MYIMANAHSKQKTRNTTIKIGIVIVVFISIYSYSLKLINPSNQSNQEIPHANIFDPDKTDLHGCMIGIDNPDKPDCILMNEMDRNRNKNIPEIHIVPYTRHSDDPAYKQLERSISLGVG